VVLGTGVDPAVNEAVRRMAGLIRMGNYPGIEAVVPSYATLAIHYDPLRIGFPDLADLVSSLEGRLDESDIPQPRVVEIPVFYGGEMGPDIDVVAGHNRIGVADVIRIHTGPEYHIYAIGFAPGFCYLGGLDSRLHTPRLETPRVRVVAGSVGIAGAQTGVYPLDSPGGWQLIGRTPLRLFAPERPDPVRYQAGDRIRFRSISREEYHQIQLAETS
jgi:KipI family sensor histidine kinase inhibitor